MKSILKVLFLALVFGVYSCSPKGDGTVSEVVVNGNKMYVFSLNSLKSDTATIPLSSLVENCYLVPLENSDDAYFSPWFTTVTEKYIGVRQQGGDPYKLFDSSGKFLCNVGAVGQGPGEYSISLYDDIIDDKNELIFLTSMIGDKILVYNTSGQFLKNIVAPHRIQKPKMFLSDDVLTVVHLPFNDNRAFAIQFDVHTGDVLKELAPPAHLIVHNFDGELFNTRSVSNIFDFIHTDSDTLYHFDMKNNEILPVFTMTYSSSENIWKQYYQLNKDLFLSNIQSLRDNRFTNVGIVATDLTSKKSSWIKVVNDYYGNMPVPIGIGSVRNGYWVYNIQPEQLMENIENRLAEGSCTENEKEVLRKTLSTLEEGANNVVFIGKLKSEIELF
jgi:hypothetical protein